MIESTGSGWARGVALAAALLLAAPLGAQQTRHGKQCEKAISASLASCFDKASWILNDCYAKTGRPCPARDFDKEREKLDGKVRNSCDTATVRSLGYGPQATVDAVIVRLQVDCVAEAETLARRAFGGPQAAVLAGADESERDCLLDAAKRGRGLMQRALELQSKCVRTQRTGKSCDLARIGEKVAAQEQKALDRIGAACGDLKGLIGLTDAQFADRALAQSRCMVATAHPDPSPLDLDCGPRSEVSVPPRGTWTQIVLDQSQWGTKCGDGSDYAFQIRLAPSGSPVENVLFHLQGGGVCIFESDCLAVPARLFEALSDGPPSGGFNSTNPADNPFWNWTMVFLPYCTQDVHFGGGTTSDFPGITVERFGGINVRTAMRYVRDVLWAELDATTVDGYRPDLLHVIFSGLSAGGFGVMFNHHFPLDELRWDHTTIVPDSSLSLDNGEVIGVRNLGAILISEVPPLGWGTLPIQAPYCLATSCGVGPILEAAAAPRLKAVPEQQILNVSNQVDNTQVSTTFFSSQGAWTQAVRDAYCSLQGSNGIRYFMPAISSSIHTMLGSTTRFNTTTSDGVTLRDWLDDAIANPDGVVDLVEEGTLSTNPEVEPFACNVD